MTHTHAFPGITLVEPEQRVERAMERRGRRGWHTRGSDSAARPHATRGANGPFFSKRASWSAGTGGL